MPGGKIEEGENPEEALIREIDEELDCEIKAGKKIKEVHHEYDHAIINLSTYEAEIIKGEPAAKEHAELKWLPLRTQKLH